MEEIEEVKEVEEWYQGLAVSGDDALGGGARQLHSPESGELRRAPVGNGGTRQAVRGQRDKPVGIPLRYARSVR